MQVCEYLLLPGMVLGDGEGHKLIQRKPVLPIDLQQLRADRAKTKPLLHHTRRHTEPRADLLRPPTLVIGKFREPLELVGGVHRGRSAERRVGKECVVTGSARGSPYY